MKKALFLTLAALTATTGFAQGLVSFSSFNDEDQIRLDTGAFPGPNIVISLFLASDRNTPLATTTFLNGTGFINPPDSGDVVVPGIPVLGTATLVLRFYEAGKTFATSWIRGESSAFTAGPLGGPNGANPPVIPPDLSNMTAFVNQTPEPSSIALGALGVGALLVRRRR